MQHTTQNQTRRFTKKVVFFNLIKIVQFSIIDGDNTFSFVNIDYLQGKSYVIVQYHNNKNAIVSAPIVDNIYLKK